MILRSRHLSADTQVATRRNLLYGIICSAHTGTLDLFDEATNASTAGKKRFHISATTGGTTALLFPYPVQLDDGLYADLTGAGLLVTLLTN